MKTSKTTVILAAALAMSAPFVVAQTATVIPVATTTAKPVADTTTACFDPVKPVVDLDIPSRYKTGSKNRSDFDAEANAAVETALKPIDSYVGLLSKSANAAMSENDAEQKTLIADCVVDRMDEWASANAISDLSSQGAQLSMPARVAAIAMSYAQVRPLATTDERQARIEFWLAERARNSMVFFDNDAPPKSSQNNLRAWAALEAAQVGILVGDNVMKNWADASVRLVACTANADGSLPNEMWRGKLALHYQIHAVGPLVVSAALLADYSPDLFDTCDQAILRAARFAVTGAQNPAIVETVAGIKQSFDASPDKLKAYEFAWLVPLMQNVDAPDLQAFASQFKVLSNSKLGGKQDLIWSDEAP